MKIHYREHAGTIEIVRCFGSDPCVVLPERICGKPVACTAAYAFSARKGAEDSDIQIWETDDSGMFREEEHLLAGDAVTDIVFPDSMEEIGNYIFYGCRELKGLEFSDRLSGVGSGAFTGCSSLNHLRVRLEQSRKSCVGQILGDLWQRIDVTFLEHSREARLVFPEHYEEAVENTPARILFTQHHGSGNNYRQCFFNKEMDYRKYDELFSVAKVQDHVNVLADMAFGRLMFPEELTQSAEREYEAWICEQGEAVGKYLTDCRNTDVLREMSKRGLWERESLDRTLEYAAAAGRTEVSVLLMNERHRMFPERKSRYEL